MVRLGDLLLTRWTLVRDRAGNEARTAEARLLLERAAAFVAALCLLGDFRFSDSAGFLLAVACVIWQWRQRPRNLVAAV